MTLKGFEGLTADEMAKLTERAIHYRNSGWRDSSRSKFRNMAVALGFRGRTGGWIYREEALITQGWQSFAMMLTDGALWRAAVQKQVREEVDAKVSAALVAAGLKPLRKS